MNFEKIDSWILEQMGNGTPTRSYVHGNPERLLLNRGNRIAGIIFGFKEINFDKIDFWSKTYENFPKDQWLPVWNIWEIVHLSEYMQMEVQRVLFRNMLVG